MNPAWLPAPMRRFFEAPRLPTQDLTNAATKLWSVLWGCIILANILLPIALFFLDEASRWRFASQLVAFDLAAVVCLLLVKAGRPSLATHLMLVALLLIQIRGCLFSGGVSAPGTMTLLVIISFTTILLDIRSTLIYTAVVLATASTLLWMEKAQCLPPQSLHHTSVSRWILFVCFALLIASVAVLASWATRRADEAARRNAEEKEAAVRLLRQSEEKYSKAFCNGPVMVLISYLDDGVILEANELALKVMGFSREELFGYSAAELGIFTQEQRSWICNQVRERGHVANHETKIRTKSKEIRTLLLSANLLSIQEQTCLLTVAIDITDQRLLEEKFRQAQKMEAVGQLAGGIAHDYNNLLTAEFMQLSLLLSSAGLPDEVREGLTSLQELSQRSARLTRQLLTFSRKQPVSMADLDLCVLVANLSGMLGRLIGAHIRMVHEYQQQQVFVHADLGMIEQVITNLVVNARDAIGDKEGQITLSVTLQEASPPHEEKTPAGAYVRLSVSDTGCGMTEEVRQRIFEPFFTTKEAGKGTGLGLATVFGIMRQHGGWVDVESWSGRGSRFSVFFPQVDRPERPDREQEGLAKCQRRETILLVEDEAAVRTATATALERQGHKVILAADGPSAMGTFLSYDGTIDLTLTDTHMPGGMSGIELARQLRQGDGQMGIIVVSGYSKAIEEGEINAIPGVVFLKKPYSIEVLARAVEQALRWRSEAPVE